MATGAWGVEISLSVANFDQLSKYKSELQTAFTGAPPDLTDKFSCLHPQIFQ